MTDTTKRGCVVLARYPGERVRLFDSAGADIGYIEVASATQAGKVRLACCLDRNIRIMREELTDDRKS